MRYDGARSVLTLAATLLAPAAALAQQPVRCGPGETPILSLGISGLECRNCTLFGATESPGNMRWEFRSEPTVLNVRPGGPADNRLRAGDVIVAIDGNLITTREGGRRLLQPADRAVELRVRRDGRETNVTVSPEAECRPDHAATPVPPAPPVAAVRPTRPVPVAPPAPATTPAPPSPLVLLPTGWLGFSFSCSACRVRVDDDSNAVWSFAEPPLVTAVEPGSPAARAGIRVGDRLVSVDEQAITSARGGERFGGITSGERVAVGIQRDGRERVVEVTAGSRSGIRSAPVPPSRAAPVAEPRSVGIGSSGTPQPETVRYSGRIGDTMINVTGRPVVVTETETEIIIRSGDITVRLRRDTARIR